MSELGLPRWRQCRLLCFGKFGIWDQRVPAEGSHYKNTWRSRTSASSETAREIPPLTTLLTCAFFRWPLRVISKSPRTSRDNNKVEFSHKAGRERKNANLLKLISIKSNQNTRPLDSESSPAINENSKKLGLSQLKIPETESIAINWLIGGGLVWGFVRWWLDGNLLALTRNRPGVAVPSVTGLWQKKCLSISILWRRQME